MELPISFPFLRSHVNREIDPLSGWCGLKFQVSLRDVWIGGEEYLANVAIPKTDRFLRSLRRGVDNKRFGLFAAIANVQGFFGPDESGFGMPARGSFRARPVARDRYGTSLSPFRVVELISGQIARAVMCFDDVV